MAAARRARRRVHRLRRRPRRLRRRKQPMRRIRNRKLMKRHRQRRKNQRRKVMTKKDRPSKRLKYNCNQFVAKVLSRLHRDRIHISTKAKGKMISFIRRFYNRISEQAKRSKKDPSSNIISSKDLQKALKRVMGKEEAMKLADAIRRASRRC